MSDGHRAWGVLSRSAKGSMASGVCSREMGRRLSVPETLRGACGHCHGLSSGMEDGLELVRDKARLRLWGRRDMVQHLVLVGSPGREPCVPSAHRLLCFCKAPLPRHQRLTFLLVLLTPQARPHSSKALAGRVLTLLSEASFPRPRGPHISPLSTGHCPPAESSRSCTGRWPPSTARTGEAPPLAAGPVCPHPHLRPALWVAVTGGGLRVELNALLSPSWNS